MGIGKKKNYSVSFLFLSHSRAGSFGMAMLTMVICIFANPTAGLLLGALLSFLRMSLHASQLMHGIPFILPPPLFAQSNSSHFVRDNRVIGWQTTVYFFGGQLPGPRG
jgi:hypothetical protein